jgi:hypothetical protein
MAKPCTDADQTKQRRHHLLPRLIVYLAANARILRRATFDEVEGYDPKANRWTSFASPPTGLHAHAAATVKDTAYFIGGSSGCGADGPSKAVYSFRLP